MAKKRTDRDIARAIHFQRWFKPVLQSVGIGAFMREFYGTSATGGQPRAVVRNWRDAKATIKPQGAFRVGQAFRSLGVKDADGLVALVASGCYADFIATLRVLARTSHTRSLVPHLVAIAPLAAAWRQGCVYDAAAVPDEVVAELNQAATEIHRRLERRHKTGRPVPSIQPKRATEYKRTPEDEAVYTEAIARGLAALDATEQGAIARAFEHSFSNRNRVADSPWATERDAVAAALQTGAIDAPSWYAIYPALVAWTNTLYAGRLDPKYHNLYRRIAFNERT
jgi:hypothetical protein